jgi:hypothetical protein
MPVAARGLAGFQQAQAPGGPAGLQPLISLLLLFRGNHGLTRVTALPDPRPRDKFGAAAAALFCHRLLERENAWFLGQKMRIMKIAMIHVRTLVCVDDQSVRDSRSPRSGDLAHEMFFMYKKATPKSD